MAFDYDAPAELFVPKRTKRAHTNNRRFSTAAEAIRFAVEMLPSLRTLGASLQVGDKHFNADEIHRLYEADDYPLSKVLNDAD